MTVQLSNATMFLGNVSSVLYERQKAYGPPKECLERIATRWSQTLGVTVTPKQVIRCMIDLKLARLCDSPDHMDSMTDIAGYAALTSEV